MADGHDGPTAAEKAVMAVSAIITVSLFAYVLVHGLAAPPDQGPEAAVTGTTDTGDGLVVTVELRNRQRSGLISATVEADCGPSPPTITFENVPASGERTGTLTCPANASEPDLAIVAWEVA
jgi:hypothetical protein